MQPKRILIVDDEDHIREIAGVTLELTHGWHIDAVNCGKDAIRAAIAKLPDAILLDVMMPEMHGPSTLRLLRADNRTRSIPIIFLTAKVQSADKRNLLQLGADGIIAKPFDPLVLGAEIAETLQWT